MHDRQQALRQGHGADHQVDVFGEFAFTLAFSVPVRLFLEASSPATHADYL